MLKKALDFFNGKSEPESINNQLMKLSSEFSNKIFDKEEIEEKILESIRYGKMEKINEKDTTDKNNTPLIKATLMNNFDIVEALLKRHAETNIKNTDDKNALDIATEKRYTGIAELLKKYSMKDGKSISRRKKSLRKKKKSQRKKKKILR